jgi:hypothetical protein
LQPAAKSRHVVTCNLRVRLPRVSGP